MAANVLEADALHHSWSCDSNGWPLHLRLRLLPCQTNPTWTQVLWFLRIIPRIIEIETSTTKRKQSIFFFFGLSWFISLTMAVVLRVFKHPSAIRFKMRPRETCILTSSGHCIRYLFPSCCFWFGNFEFLLRSSVL